jgi:hypothetical protein
MAGEIKVLSSMCERAPHDFAFIKRSRLRIDKHQARLLRVAGEILCRGIDERDETTVKSALRVFATVRQQAAAHRLFQEQCVRPALAQAASRMKQDYGTTATAELYTAAGDFLQRESTRCLLAAAADLELCASEKAQDVANSPRFDFIAESIWIEVYAAAKDVIFRPASDDFHPNYRLSTEFIELLESTYKTRSSLLGFRDHTITTSFHSKWELHGKTYFQLHRNEVVRQVELSLNSTVESERQADAGGDTAQTQTPATAMSQLVVRMWQADVYLPTQTADFLRLTLDLVARFRAWLHESFCSPEEEEQQEKEKEAGEDEKARIPVARRVVAVAEAQKFTEEYEHARAPTFPPLLLEPCGLAGF